MQTFIAFSFEERMLPYYRIRVDGEDDTPLKPVRYGCMAHVHHALQGHPPRIEVLLERRMGRKVVTLVRNLEVCGALRPDAS